MSIIFIIFRQRAHSEVKDLVELSKYITTELKRKKNTCGSY